MIITDLVPSFIIILHHKSVNKDDNVRIIRTVMMINGNKVIDTKLYTDIINSEGYNFDYDNQNISNSNYDNKNDIDEKENKSITNDTIYYSDYN